MRAAARIEAVRDGAGTTRIARAAGEPPLVPRITGTGQVHLVGAAAGPLPGDILLLEIRVGPGASLSLAQVAATMAQPGPDPALPWSVLTIDVEVADGGSLEYLGSPLVAVAGCRHRTEVTIRLAGDARLVWRDLVVPGRSGEASGDAVSALSVFRKGAPVLQQELGVGDHAPGWRSSAVLGPARCVGNLLLSGPADWRPAATARSGARAVLMPLAAEGSALGTAVGDAVEVERELAAMRAQLPAVSATRSASVVSRGSSGPR